jgi:hypothetical protein
MTITPPFNASSIFKYVDFNLVKTINSGAAVSVRFNSGIRYNQVYFFTELINFTLKLIQLNRVFVMTKLVMTEFYCISYFLVNVLD